MTTTRDQIVSSIRTTAAIAEAIRELGQVPSGHLYAHVMPHMELAAYNRIIETLKATNLVKEENFLLVWIGPAKKD